MPNSTFNIDGRDYIQVGVVEKLLADVVRSEVKKAVSELGLRPETERPWRTVREIAARYDVTEKTIRKWVADRKISALRQGSVIRINPITADRELFEDDK